MASNLTYYNVVDKELFEKLAKQLAAVVCSNTPRGHCGIIQGHGF